MANEFAMYTAAFAGQVIEIVSVKCANQLPRKGYSHKATRESIIKRKKKEKRRLCTCIDRQRIVSSVPILHRNDEGKIVVSL